MLQLKTTVHTFSSCCTSGFLRFRSGLSSSSWCKKHSSLFLLYDHALSFPFTLIWHQTNNNLMKRAMHTIHAYTRYYGLWSVTLIMRQTRGPQASLDTWVSATVKWLFICIWTSIPPNIFQILLKQEASQHVHYRNFAILCVSLYFVSWCIYIVFIQLMKIWYIKKKNTRNNAISLNN